MFSATARKGPAPGRAGIYSGLSTTPWQPKIGWGKNKKSVFIYIVITMLCITITCTFCRLSLNIVSKRLNVL